MLGRRSAWCITACAYSCTAVSVGGRLVVVSGVSPSAWERRWYRVCFLALFLYTLSPTFRYLPSCSVPFANPVDSSTPIRGHAVHATAVGAGFFVLCLQNCGRVLPFRRKSLDFVVHRSWAEREQVSRGSGKGASDLLCVVFLRCFGTCAHPCLGILRVPPPALSFGVLPVSRWHRLVVGAG